MSTTNLSGTDVKIAGLPDLVREAMCVRSLYRPIYFIPESSGHLLYESPFVQETQSRLKPSPNGKDLQFTPGITVGTHYPT